MVDRADDPDRPDELVGVVHDGERERIDAGQHASGRHGPTLAPDRHHALFKRFQAHGRPFGHGCKLLPTQALEQGRRSESEGDKALGRCVERHQGADRRGDLDRRSRTDLEQDADPFRLHLADGRRLAAAVSKRLEHRPSHLHQAVVAGVGLAHQIDAGSCGIPSRAFLSDIACAGQGPQGPEQPGLGLAKAQGRLGDADRSSDLDQVLQHAERQQHRVHLVVGRASEPRSTRPAASPLHHLRLGCHRWSFPGRLPAIGAGLSAG